MQYPKTGAVGIAIAVGNDLQHLGVYTVEFAEAVYVVDAFQKKSKRGIATPQEDIDRNVQRIKSLRQDRGTAAGKTFIEELLALHAIRQRIIDEKRKKQHEPK